ncbi:TPA: DNA cytosine methyltransferase [Bacillus cereus]
MNNKAVCLFSSAGIGELGIVNNNIDIILSNELLEDRHKLHETNYPNTFHVPGDIWDAKETIVSKSQELLGDEELFLIYATPPCQGMSSTGAGKLLDEIKKGKRKILDERNRLIIPTVEIISKLKPKWIIFENVENMKNTIIQDEDNRYVNIMDYIERKLGNEYVGSAEVVNCADYAIPQSRKRLITIYTRDERGIRYFDLMRNFFIESEKLTPNNQITLRYAIGHLPPLNAREGENSRLDVHPFYSVPTLSDERYAWVKHTKEGTSAFNNQCINESCGYEDNKKHGSNTKGGIHSSNKDTPLYCEKCGSLLPRPSTLDKKTGERRLIKGYETTYARMEWDKPAKTLTQNFQYESSGKHLHPEQNRVLSIYEGLILQTIADYQYNFSIDGKVISRNKIAEVIGESVPPKLIDIICEKINSITEGSYQLPEEESQRLVQLNLFGEDNI